ncbi:MULTISPECIES: enoyl-CoA hydratase-related protein [Shewanella]|uniref:enoyl-CoA hydratase-related protein n=1 Tax=Shewanella TaxID=22 RepID=UPI001C65551A|nr:enoyl-CoA hydratase-related protein [Shewanella psychrotolerans]QYK01665.1 enoyl-CoA hydratase/isomerase family protein [Shewanella psychrotolerans]
MDNYQFVKTERQGKVGIVTFNRPEAMNALNQQVVEDVTNALKAFDADDSVGCMILAGGEKAFCAGADLKWIADVEFEEAYQKDYAAYMDQVAELRKPVIAAVRGFAFGGGTEISLMCDMILADKTAQFGLTEVTLGVIPGGGGTQRMAHRIGKYKAMRYILTGDWIKAEEAERIGLITEVVEGDVVEEAVKLATKIANNPRLAVLAGKESVNQQAEMPITEGRKVERRLFHALFGTADKKEGMAAFAEKRKPNYKQY